MINATIYQKYLKILKVIYLITGLQNTVLKFTPQNDVQMIIDMMSNLKAKALRLPRGKQNVFTNLR